MFSLAAPQHVPHHSLQPAKRTKTASCCKPPAELVLTAVTTCSPRSFSHASNLYSEKGEEIEKKNQMDNQSVLTAHVRTSATPELAEDADAYAWFAI